MNKHAFSLIELMVVIAIIGFLTAIAAPSYRKYSIKSKISSSNEIVKNIKNAIAEYNTNIGRLPNAAAIADRLGISGTYADGDDIPMGDVNNISKMKIMPITNGIQIELFLNFDVKEVGRSSYFVNFIEEGGYYKTLCGLCDTTNDTQINDNTYMPGGCNDNESTGLTCSATPAPPEDDPGAPPASPSP